MSDDALLTDKPVLTRKEHQCFGCLRVFPAGSRMQYWSGVFDGDFGAGYSCDTCNQFMKLGIGEDNYDGLFREGFVREMLRKDQTPEQLLEEEKRCISSSKTVSQTA